MYVRYGEHKYSTCFRFVGSFVCACDDTKIVNVGLNSLSNTSNSPHSQRAWKKPCEMKCASCCVVALKWPQRKKRRSNTRTSLDNNTNDFVRPIWYAALSMRTKTTLKYYNLWSIRARYFCAIPLHVHRKATRIILFFYSLSLFKATFRGLRTSRMVVIKWLYAEGIQ